MPTYQYRCTACEHQFEAVQSFSDASLTTCPVCSGTLRKLFSAVGIVFKGSGFYRTDSRSGSGKAVTSGDASSKNGAAKDGGSTNGSGAKVGAASGSGSSGSSTSTSTPAAAAS